MDIPIQMYLMDNRILHDPMDALLGVVSGNLVYKKIIFTIRPGFAMSLLDENLSMGLNLYHRIDRLIMPPRSKAVTLHCKALYAFTTTHQKEINKVSGDFIQIHEDFKDLAQFTPPRMLSNNNISLPQDILLDFHQQSRRIDNNVGNQGLVTLNTSGQLIARMPSRRIERSISTRELASSSRTSTSRNYPIMPRNSIDIDLRKCEEDNFLILTEYINNQNNYEEIIALVNTGASTSHIRADLVDHLLEENLPQGITLTDYHGIKYEIKTFVNLELSFTDIEGEQFKLNLKIHKDYRKGKDSSPILLGMNFLEKVSPFHIQKNTLQITIEDKQK